MRLESVWQRLQVSQEERIAIAIQYSHPEFSFHIPKVKMTVVICVAQEVMHITIKN